jgi:hypothetical protein
MRNGYHVPVKPVKPWVSRTRKTCLAGGVQSSTAWTLSHVGINYKNRSAVRGVSVRNRGKGRQGTKPPFAGAKRNSPPVETGPSHPNDTKVRNAESLKDPWREPWIRLLKFLNLQVAHLTGLVVLALLAEVAARVFTLFAQEPLTWEFRGISVSLLEIVHYGDLAVLGAFILVFIFELAKWILQI